MQGIRISATAAGKEPANEEATAELHVCVCVCFFKDNLFQFTDQAEYHI